MLWKSGSVELRIWPLDHCPPHVTAVCRADAWTARFVFSMVADTVSLWDVKPLRNAPTLAVLKGLASQIHANRRDVQGIVVADTADGLSGQCSRAPGASRSGVAA
jgi:hypothetical protein